MSPAADSTTRFSSRVSDYIAHRPSYATESLHYLAQKFPHLTFLPSASTSTSQGKIILDIGSGTGILTQQLLLQFPSARVIGIEPNAEMRKAGDEILASHIEDGRFSSQDGTAESTGLEDDSVDLIVAAQAFHWFDVPRARKECMRILKKDGKAGVALFWNDRRGVVDHNAPIPSSQQVEGEGGSTANRDEVQMQTKTTLQLDRPITDAYDLLLVKRLAEYPKVSHANNVGDKEMRDFFGSDGFESASFENPYKMDFEQLQGRLLSSSYSLQEGQDGYEEMMGDLKMLFERYQRDGKIDFVYDTRVFWGAMSE